MRRRGIVVRPHRVPTGAGGLAALDARTLPGMHTHLDDAGRIDGMLSSEPVVWLSTVRPDGSPHLVPIWFSWDGRRLFAASKPGARKVCNLRVNPRLMLAVGEPEDDFDVALLEAVAELPSASARELLPPGHLRKHRRRLRAAGLTEDEYWRTYSQAIVITPTRFLPWHGRTEPPSLLPAGSGRRLPGVMRRLVAALPRPALTPPHVAA